MSELEPTTIGETPTQKYIIYKLIDPHGFTIYYSNECGCDSAILNPLLISEESYDLAMADARKTVWMTDKGLPQNVINLVIAARVVADNEGSAESLKTLDKAAEAFADRVTWGSY